MTQVAFEIQAGKDSEPTPVAFDVDDAQRERFALFRRNVVRLRSAKILENFPTVQSIKFTAEEGMTFKISDFDYAQVYELLHLARPLFLKNEPASFERTLGFIGRVGAKSPLALWCKQCRTRYEQGDYQPMMQLTINGTPIFHNSTLETWLNGLEYHQDPEKAVVIEALEKTLTTDVARGFFVAQLSGRLSAILRVDNVVGMILGKLAGKQQGSGEALPV